MEKVLHIFHHLNNAGTEMVMMNLYKNINKSKIQFDFCVYDDGTIEQEFLDMGAEIYKIKEKNRKKFYLEFLKFLKKTDYKVVHIHMCGMMYHAVIAAKKAKIPCIIVHSHNGKKKVSILSKIKRIILEITILRKATDYFACSEIAAKYVFPLNHKKVKIINNAIDIEKFKYDAKVREKKRKELKLLENEKMIINVGRLEEQKNQLKIIEIAKVDKNPNIKYFIAGEGALKEKLHTEIIKNGLEEKVMLLGNRNDIDELLCASDMFLMTSIFEGLGIVLIESQVSGLKTLSSDSIPEEANLKLGNFWTYDLNKLPEKWAKKIQEILKEDIDRTKISKKSKNTDYNIKKIANYVEKFYLTKIRES